jgi:FkbM family methyltransferase
MLYNKHINKAVRSILKPVSVILPGSLKFPVSGEFTVRGKTVPPFKMRTNPTSAVTKFVFWGDVEGFEYNAVQVFLKLVDKSSLFYDIGSNIGYYSLLAAAVSKNKIRSYAFEPMPSAFDYLQQNITLNQFSNIVPVKLALSDSQGTATFHAIENPKFSGMPQLTGDGSLNGNSSINPSKVTFDVAIDTLDHFAAQHAAEGKIDLIKLDTEAKEHKVLQGAKTVLAQHRPIIQCEILKNQIEKELEAALAGFDYVYFRATHDGLVPVERLTGNTSAYHDHYLVPREKMELIRSTGFLLEK